jgi:hypothetical protein
MDSLPDWAVSIIAVAVGLSPGLAILSAGSIARLIYRVLGPRRELAAEHGPSRNAEIPPVWRLGGANTD